MKGKFSRYAGIAGSKALLKRLVSGKYGSRGTPEFFRARFYRSTKIRLSLILPLRESCWGVPSPNPAYALPAFRPRSKGGHRRIAKKYNTPHRSRVVKTRMTEEEYADFTGRLEHYDISQAEFIRQAITRATIRPIVTVSPVNDELLAAVGKLTAEYGKIGGNLNQIARALNEYGTPYNALSGEYGQPCRPCRLEV